MKDLPKAVRNKAIQIANKILEEKNDIDECILMEIVINKAKGWAKDNKLSKNKKIKTRGLKQSIRNIKSN